MTRKPVNLWGNFFCIIIYHRQCCYSLHALFSVTPSLHTVKGNMFCWKNRGIRVRLQGGGWKTWFLFSGNAGLQVICFSAQTGRCFYQGDREVPWLWGPWLFPAYRKNIRPVFPRTYCKVPCVHLRQQSFYQPCALCFRENSSWLGGYLGPASLKGRCDTCPKDPRYPCPKDPKRLCPKYPKCLCPKDPKWPCP